MAEGWTQSVRCRFFQRGVCHYGSRCRFLHIELPSSTVGSSEDGARGGETMHTDKPGTSASNNALVQHQEPKNKSGTSRKVTALKKQENSADSGIGEDPNDNWVNAPEFIPLLALEALVITPKSYAEACNPHPGSNNEPAPAEATQAEKLDTKLCPYQEQGTCKYAGKCLYLHGEVCELCGHACLHPFDKDQQKKHINECIKQHERDMELSFAIQRSKDKTCGVCFEVIMEKSPREQRFGILPNCNHCFCLACIRKWRQAKQFENKIIRACPECRVTSDFVCPSMYWVDTKEDKEKLIKDYKGALSVKDCKYFKSGRGKCPFGNKCFYLHAYPDGTKADVGPPVRQRRRHADGEIDVLQQIILWDFLDERENRWLYSIDDVEDIVAFFSDSEDSDWSDYDFFFD